MMKMTGPHIRTFFKVAISFACLAWVISRFSEIDLTVSGDMLRHMSPGLFAATLILFIALSISRILRLRYWFGALPGVHLTLGAWVEIYLKSTIYGSLTPARLGDASRVFMLEATEVPLKKRGILFLYEKIADSLYIPAGLLVAAPLLIAKTGFPAVILLALGISIFLVYCAVTLGLVRLMGAGALLAGLLYTVAGFVLFVAGNTLIFRTLAIDLAVADVTAIAIGAGMAASLPASMGGIGVREGVLAVLLGLWGVSPERVPPILLFEFFINTILPVILYLAWRRVAAHTLSAPAP